MNIKLGKHVWRLQHIDLGPVVRGEIDPPSYVKPHLKISTRLRKNEEILEVILHECLHGCFWAMEEEVIDRAAMDIAKVLYGLGARIDTKKFPEKQKTKRS